MCLLGTNKHLRGEEWCTITFCHCYRSCTCYSFSFCLYWDSNLRLSTLHFGFRCLLLDVCCNFGFPPFCSFASTFHKLLATLLAFNSFALLAFRIRLRIYLWVCEFVEQAVLRLVELRLCKLVWIRFLVLFFGYLEFAFVWFIDIQCNWTTEFCLSILL